MILILFNLGMAGGGAAQPNPATTLGPLDASSPLGVDSGVAEVVATIVPVNVDPAVPLGVS